MDTHTHTHTHIKRIKKTKKSKTIKEQKKNELDATAVDPTKLFQTKTAGRSGTLRAESDSLPNRKLGKKKQKKQRKTNKINDFFLNKEHNRVKKDPMPSRW